MRRLALVSVALLLLTLSALARWRRAVTVLRRPPLVIAAICLLSSYHDAAAYDLSNGVTIDCVVQTSEGPYTVPVFDGDAHGFAAITQLGPGGLPMIVFDVVKFGQVRARLPVAGDFLFYHECGHARFGLQFAGSPQLNELGPNCEGLRKMRADGNILPAQEAALGQFHVANKVYENLFGSAAHFWQLTVQCAGRPPSVAEYVYRLGGPAPVGPPGSTSTLCRFITGPLAGQTRDYAPQAPVPIGSPCFDGPSKGVVGP